MLRVFERMSNEIIFELISRHDVISDDKWWKCNCDIRNK